MPDSTTTMLIADMLADAEFDVSVADRPLSIALDKSVEVLKSAVPFQLPVRIVTCDLPARDIVLEDAREPYSRVLLRWLAVFAGKPVLEGTDLKDFISLVRNISSDKISRAFERKWHMPPGLRRTQGQDECDLCDEVSKRPVIPS